MSKSTYTDSGAGWGEIAARAREIRSEYLAAQFRKAAARLFANRRGS